MLSVLWDMLKTLTSRFSHARAKRWLPVVRTLPSQPLSEHVQFRWMHEGPAIDAQIVAGKGVRCTSRGRASAIELERGQSIEGIYHWGEEVERPILVLEWHEGSGAKRRRENYDLTGHAGP